MSASEKSSPRWKVLEDEAEAIEPPFKTLSAEEARVLRGRISSLKPSQVVVAQAVCGLLIALAWWLATGSLGKAGSALWGAAAVVVPNALMAWGMARALRGFPAAAAAGFMFWELIKIMLAVALLAAAAKWMPDLSWPALLVALIGCLKVNWLALLWQGRRKNRDGH